MSPAPRPHDVSSTTPADPGTPAHADAAEAAHGAAAGSGEEHARVTVRTRLRRELADLDYVRALHRWAATGTSQRDIARQLGMSQPAVSKHLARSADVAQPLPGFDGATPLELCKRYAAGWLSRGALIAQLVTFPWTPMPALTGWEDPLVLPEGTWQDLSQAHGMRYIDLDIYEEVRARHTAQQQQRDPGFTPVSPWAGARAGTGTGTGTGAPAAAPTPAPSSPSAPGADAYRAAEGAGGADGPPHP